MTTIPTSSRSRSVRRFLLHYLEMVVAMLAGMVLLGPLWTLAVPGLPPRPDLGALVMATDMALGMAAWMAVRRHRPRHVAEMSLAMYLPFAVLLVPFWTGLIDGDALMVGGHVLMLPAMALAMLRHRGAYA